MKWLYGRHTYGWSTEQLSYYISLMGGSRTIFLLFLLPSMYHGFSSFLTLTLYFSVYLSLQA